MKRFIYGVPNDRVEFLHLVVCEMLTIENLHAVSHVHGNDFRPLLQACFYRNWNIFHVTTPANPKNVIYFGLTNTHFIIWPDPRCGRITVLPMYRIQRQGQPR